MRCCQDWYVCTTPRAQFKLTPTPTPPPRSLRVLLPRSRCAPLCALPTLTLRPALRHAVRSPTADLGLARIFQAPLQPLVVADRVVVTIWYRSPELLLGAKHYTKAVGPSAKSACGPTGSVCACVLTAPMPVAWWVPPLSDVWSIGCIFAELLMLHSLFKGKEVKAQANNRNPFQRSQLEKIFDYLGLPGRTCPCAIHAASTLFLTPPFLPFFAPPTT